MECVRWIILSVLASAATVRAQQFGGYYNYDGSPYSSNNNNNNGDSGSGSGSGSTSGSDSGSSGSGPGVGNFGANFDIDAATRLRAIHGILGAVAMVVLFPGGALVMRVVSGRVALWTHVLMQILAIGVLVAAVVMGIRLVQQVREFGVDLMEDPSINYHPIIGLVVMAFLILQPGLGLIHHEKFKKLQRRQVWSYLHIVNGRVMITLGIINGGFGLWMARASDTLKIAYIAVAGGMWTAWIGAAMWYEWRRWWNSKQPGKRRESRETWESSANF